MEKEQEKDMLFLMVLAAFGGVLASGLATYYQWIGVVPLTIAVFLIMVLTALLTRKKAIHFSEKLETWAMILTLLAFIASFIYLFRPA
jgi:energy-converting hydrogenase A subunit K